jgi:hypothetical protein
VLLINVFLAIGYVTLSAPQQQKRSRTLAQLQPFTGAKTHQTRSPLSATFSADLIDECAVDTSEEHARREAIYSTSLTARFLEAAEKHPTPRAPLPKNVIE